MKIFFYALREFDELAVAERCCREMGIEFGYTSDYPSEENYALAQGYEAISVTPCNMSAPVVDIFHSYGVRYILCRSIGYDHVDRQRAHSYGMRVSNVSYPPSGVAGHTVMLMLMTTRRIMQAMERARVQDYTLKGKIGRDISYMTVGIIGTGRIGREVMKDLSGFGCKILCYDPFQNEEAEKYGEYVSLEELYERSDIISLHSNVTEENTHLLNDAAFEKMKKGVAIINTARGKLIDTAALLRALKSGKIGAAGLDVLENENGLYYYDRTGDIIDLPEFSELGSMPNVILSPHTAFYTEEAVYHMVLSVFESARAFENNEATEHEVVWEEKKA